MRSLRSSPLVRLVVLLTAVVLAACTPGCHRAATRAKVVASVFPVYDLVRRIAGPDADVTLVKPGDAATAEAKLVVAVGLGMDPWMEAAAAPKTRILRVGDRVPTIATSAGAMDPHVWMDPQRARLMVTAIAEELARVDSSHANAFRERAAAVDASLDALDRDIDGHAGAWKGRTVATDDPGMAYFGERYHLDVVGPNAAKPGAVHMPLDSTGEHAPADSYEALLRADTAALDSALR